MKKYDLEQRTTVFGFEIIKLCKSIKIDFYNRNVISQIIRSATSIGANYREANCASSKKDFRNKIYICIKEANETKYWLKMLIATNPDKKDKIFTLLQENHELVLIFQTTTSKL